MAAKHWKFKIINATAEDEDAILVMGIEEPNVQALTLRGIDNDWQYSNTMEIHGQIVFKRATRPHQLLKDLVGKQTGIWVSRIFKGHQQQKRADERVLTRW